MPDDTLTEALRRLDTMTAPCTDFEASVLETLLRRPGYASEKQRKILVQMIEKYLNDPALAAEVCGQQRLFQGDPFHA